MCLIFVCERSKTVNNFWINGCRFGISVYVHLRDDVMHVYKFSDSSFNYGHLGDISNPTEMLREKMRYFDNSNVTVSFY
jgi:hypothetical protein